MLRALVVVLLFVSSATADRVAPEPPVDELAKVALQAPSKATIQPAIGAIRALGQRRTDRPTAIATLAKVIERELPEKLGDERQLHLAVMGAAVNAIAEYADPSTIGVLLPAMYRAPELMMQYRRAIVASGRGAVVEVRKALRGEHAGVTAVFRAHKLDKGFDGTTLAPAPVSAREFYAALVLGDLHDASVTADLLAVLDHPPLPAYYVDGVPGPNQHAAVFDTLRKLGSPDAAPKLRALWQGKKDVMERAGAINTYALVARDTTAVDALSKIAADNTADDTLRQEAALAYARLAHDPAAIKLLLGLAQRYLDASAKKRSEAATKEPGKLAADAELDKAKQTLDTTKAKLLATAKDPNSTTAQIKAATTQAKRVEDDYKLAKKAHRDKTGAWKSLDSAAKAYQAFARTFQLEVARVDVAIRCGDATDCYVKTLAMTPADAATRLAKHVPDASKWSADEQQQILGALVDRAMVELGKRGKVPVDDVADALAIDNAEIQTAVVVALPKLAPPPCDRCVLRLDNAIASLAGRDNADGLKLELQLARAYFRWR